MTQTIAEIIKEKLQDLPQVIKETLNSGKPLTEQVDELMTKDSKSLQKLGENFVIPKKESLEPHLRVEFNSFLAEPLLREGSLLLDRCLQQRREYNELATKWFEACVQIDELFRLNIITEKEEKELYDVSEKIEALKKESAVLEYEDYIGGGIFTEYNGYRSRIVKEYKENGRAKPEEAQLDAELKYSTFGFESKRYQLSRAIIAKQIEEIDKKIGYERRMTVLKKERNEVARIVAIRRAKALIRENGALNYNEQMKPLKERFNNDLKAAWLRLSAAAEGFQMLYSYDSAQINSKLFKKREDNPEKLEVYDRALTFDELVTWCQLTNTWLASFLDTQQQVTRSFSLRKLINDETVFEAGKATSAWRFKLKDEHFTNMRFVRMRSFAIQIDSGHNSGSWNVSITPPSKAKNEPKDQGHIGTLYLGRVNERSYAVIPEGSSPSKLYNTSPIGEDSPSGEWTIEVSSASTSATTVNDIKDIDIHLTFAIV